MTNMENFYINQEGYSQTEMFRIINSLWKDDSIIKLKELNDIDLSYIPIFRQVKFVIDYLISYEEIKLTLTKALPTNLVKEIYSLGVIDDYLEFRMPKQLKEKDSMTVEIVHVLLKIMKLTKERNGIMTLTKKGKCISQNNVELLNLLLFAYTYFLNITYFDGYENYSIGVYAIGFSFLLVSKYGDEKRLSTFYAEKYFKAFPHLCNCIESRYSNIIDRVDRCYSLRTFERFMLQFGIIEIEKTKYPDSKTYIKKSALFDKMFQVKI